MRPAGGCGWFASRIVSSIITASEAREQREKRNGLPPEGGRQ
jgi:hypothetical protein